MLQLVDNGWIVYMYTYTMQREGGIQSIQFLMSYANRNNHKKGKIRSTFFPCFLSLKFSTSNPNSFHLLSISCKSHSNLCNIPTALLFYCTLLTPLYSACTSLPLSVALSLYKPFQILWYPLFWSLSLVASIPPFSLSAMSWIDLFLFAMNEHMRAD